MYPAPGAVMRNSKIVMDRRSFLVGSAVGAGRSLSAGARPPTG